MDLLQLENIRQVVISKLAAADSRISRLLLYFDYFENILSQNDEKLNEVFIAEFLEDYCAAISIFEVWGIDPQLSAQILTQLQSLRQKNILAVYNELFQDEIKRIEEQTSQLKLILVGETIENGCEKKALFPLIDISMPDGFYGLLESVTVRVAKAENENNFIIIPSEKEIEKRILEQCKTSWEVALRLLKNYVRRSYNYHEIIISFDRRDGFYEGDSLGAALTLSFLEALMNFYNPIYNIEIHAQTVFTGGISEEGKLVGVGKDCIRQKVRTLFYSPAETFIIPKEDERCANEELKKLKNTYPKRKLKLVAAEEVSDILNRRDIIEIRKRNILARGGKLARKHWASAAAILMTILLSWFLVIDLDDNPADAKVDGAFLHILNQKGKILQSIKFMTDLDDWRIQARKHAILFVDIDEDGENEIITNSYLSKSFSTGAKEELTAWNKKLEKLWSVGFYDTVSSVAETMSKNYHVHIFDTVSMNDKRLLLVFTGNHESYASSLFSVELKTGKRMKETLWTDGRICDGKIIYNIKERRQELVIFGINNAYEKIFFASLKFDSLDGMTPSTKERFFFGKKLVALNSYLLFPKSDFTKYYNDVRVQGIIEVNFNLKDYLSAVSISQIEERKSNVGLSFHIGLNYRCTDAIVNNQFRIKRDSLVARGILSPPFTDTKEYRMLMRDSVLYWNGNTFVHWQEMK